MKTSTQTVAFSIRLCLSKRIFRAPVLREVFMKRNCRILAVVAATMACCWHAGAQSSITYLSSLNTPPLGGSLPVAQDSWFAAGFQTGTNSAGYLLDSVDLSFGGASGTPGAFAIFIYEVPNYYFPGNRVGELTVTTNPVNAGIYRFYASNIVLSASTWYSVVITSSQPLAAGTYKWNFIGGTTNLLILKVDGWNMGFPAHSTNGIVWERVGNMNGFQFAVNASPIPEPGASWLIGAGIGLLFCSLRRRRKSPNAARSTRPSAHGPQR
jgi:hypothetical protein